MFNLTKENIGQLFFDFELMFFVQKSLKAFDFNFIRSRTSS